MLKEELQLLQEPGSYVGEVIKVRQHRPNRRRAAAWLGAQLTHSNELSVSMLKAAPGTVDRHFRLLHAATQRCTMPCTHDACIHLAHAHTILVAGHGQEQGAGQGAPRGQVRG